MAAGLAAALPFSFSLLALEAAACAQHTGKRAAAAQLMVGQCAGWAPPAQRCPACKPWRLHAADAAPPHLGGCCLCGLLLLARCGGLRQLLQLRLHPTTSAAQPVRQRTLGGKQRERAQRAAAAPAGQRHGGRRAAPPAVLGACACLPPLLVGLAADGHRVRLENLRAAQGPQGEASNWTPAAGLAVSRHTAPLRLQRALASQAAGGAGLRTLPRHASLNLVPLPQPRGHGNPILRFLRHPHSSQSPSVLQGTGAGTGSANTLQARAPAPVCLHSCSMPAHAPLAFHALQELFEAVRVVAGGLGVALRIAAVERHRVCHLAVHLQQVGGGCWHPGVGRRSCASRRRQHAEPNWPVGRPAAAPTSSPHRSHVTPPPAVRSCSLEVPPKPLALSAMAAGPPGYSGQLQQGAGSTGRGRRSSAAAAGGARAAGWALGVALLADVLLAPGGQQGGQQAGAGRAPKGRAVASNAAGAPELPAASSHEREREQRPHAPASARWQRGAEAALGRASRVSEQIPRPQQGWARQGRHEQAPPQFRVCALLAGLEVRADRTAQVLRSVRKAIKPQHRR